MRTASRFVLLLCTATMLYPQTPVRQPRFVLEISEASVGVRSHFVIVPEGRVDSTFRGHPFLHPLRGHDIRDSEKPSAIKLVCKVDGDAVEITASVFFGPLGKTDDTPLSLQGHPQQKIGTYSPHLNESIVLHEMEQLSLQPWTIKIVKVQLRNRGTPPTLYAVPSIQPQLLGVDRKCHRIALRNLP